VGSSIARESEQLQSQQRLQNMLGMVQRPQLPGPTVLSISTAQLPDQLPDVELEAEETLWAVFEYWQEPISLNLENLDFPDTKAQMDREIPHRISPGESTREWSRRSEKYRPRCSSCWRQHGLTEISLWDVIHQAWLGRLPPVEIHFEGVLLIDSTYGVQGGIQVEYGQVEYKLRLQGYSIDEIVEEIFPAPEEERLIQFLKDELRSCLPLDRNNEIIELFSLMGVESSSSFTVVMAALSNAFGNAIETAEREDARAEKLIHSAVLAAKAAEARTEEQDEAEWARMNP